MRSSSFVLRVLVVGACSWCVPLAFGLVACGSDEGSTNPGNQGSSEVQFHADVNALPGVNKDTGLQPSGSPVQLQLKVSASGTGAVDAQAVASGSSSSPNLTAKAGSGKVSVAGGFALEGRLVANISGLPSYDGPVPGLTDVKIEFSDQASFDPYLLSGKAEAKAKIPPTDLPPIPLPGGIPGSLKIKVAEGSTVNLEFSGVCAAIQGDQAQYTGSITRSGSLILRPRVEVEVPIVGTKGFDIPEITVPISVPAEAVDLGKKTVAFGAATASGEKAKVGTCEGSGAGGSSGAAGAGGASGGAGTSGAGGSKDGGTGGTGGIAQGGGGGTGGGSSGGGNGGAGGSGGAVNGGSGGVSGGGSGQGGSGGSSCLGQSCTTTSECCSGYSCSNYQCVETPDPCQQCVDGACAAKQSACQQSVECSSLWGCISGCQGKPKESECDDNCLLTYSLGQDAFFQMIGCSYAKCHDTCSLGTCLFQGGTQACSDCLDSKCSSECQVVSDSEDCLTNQYCQVLCQNITCAVDCNKYSSAGCKLYVDCLDNQCSSECQ